MHKKLKHNKYIVFLILALFSVSCIEEYKPNIKAGDTNKYVIYGNVTNQEGYQSINVSYSSGIYNPKYNPINGCDITLSDENGNEFYPSIIKNGEYKIWIPQEYLNTGTAYKIDVITPEGVQISSGYDTLYACAELDSVYYQRENFIHNIDFNYEEVQFYADMKGTSEHSRYYMYIVEETWEYRTRYLKEWLYDGRSLIHIDPPDDGTHVCWKTLMAPSLFLLSTNYLSENKSTKFPLHFVSNKSEKLAYGYSMEVTQHALTQSAYNYFKSINNNINSEGGLYSTQPEQTKGNLYNITNPGDEILGYFFASSIKAKRIFIDKVEGLELQYTDYCVEHLLWRGLRSVPYHAIPAYIENGSWLGDECIDCTKRGGKTIKPDFWPY